VRFAQTRCPDWVDREKLDHGLTEAVTNAIIHGTLGVSSSKRAGDQYREFLALSEESSEEVEPIELAIEQTLDTFAIHVRWRHNACPPSKRLPLSPPPSGSELSDYEAHGMGMHLMATLFDEVAWDTDGLGLSLRCSRLGRAA
jgi:anti-sigma regulatory factor (Ser/Thr protein kinase)